MCLALAFYFKISPFTLYVLKGMCFKVLQTIFQQHHILCSKSGRIGQLIYSFRVAPSLEKNLLQSVVMCLVNTLKIHSEYRTFHVWKNNLTFGWVWLLKRNLSCCKVQLFTHTLLRNRSKYGEMFSAFNSYLEIFDFLIPLLNATSIWPNSILPSGGDTEFHG